MLTVVIVVIVVIVIGGWIALTVVVKGKQGQGADEVRQMLGGEDRIGAFDAKAVCRGTESGEFNALVGMGSLGCNDDELVFLRWSPRELLRIERGDIVSHQFTTEHLDRDYKQPLLQVTYARPDYQVGETPGEDMVAWVVSDPDAWNEALGG